MAVVFTRRCHRLNRLVAVKILKDDLAEDADFRRPFPLGIAGGPRCFSPNIVAVYV
jgi:serine/threonine-protein kinase